MFPGWGCAERLSVGLLPAGLPVVPVFPEVVAGPEPEEAAGLPMAGRLWVEPEA